MSLKGKSNFWILSGVRSTLLVHQGTIIVLSTSKVMTANDICNVLSSPKACCCRIAGMQPLVVPMGSSKLCKGRSHCLQLVVVPVRPDGFNLCKGGVRVVGPRRFRDHPVGPHPWPLNATEVVSQTTTCGLHGEADRVPSRQVLASFAWAPGWAAR